MPHRDKSQKCNIELGMHLEWLNCTEDNDYLHSFDPSTNQTITGPQAEEFGGCMDVVLY